MRKLAILLFLACASTASAQYAEFWFNYGRSVINNGNLGTGQQFGGSPDDFKLGNGFRFRLTMGINNDRYFGHEVHYAYSRTQLEQRVLDQTGNPTYVGQGMGIHQGGYNFLLYGTREGTRIRPFVTGGVLFANFVLPGSSALQGGGNTKYGFSYGAGVKYRVTGKWAIRFDLRQIATGKPYGKYFALQSGWFKQTAITGGFGVVF